MKKLITLILILMETQSLEAQQERGIMHNETVMEVVLYKIKPQSVADFEEIKASVRKHIGEYPGFLSWKSLASVKEDRLVIDLVEWETIEDAKRAATEVEKDPKFLPFMNTTEEIRFMDHFVSSNASESEVSFTDSEYYEVGPKPSLISISEMKALTISGQSSPESEKFLRSIQTLYEAVNYLQASYANETGEFTLAPLEAFWWVESDTPFEKVPREEWFWKILLPLPEFIVEASVGDIKSALSKSYQINELKMETLPEEKAVQILHTGSYDDEAPTIEKLMDYVHGNGLDINGHHHEIYVDDPNVTPIDKLKTIIRYSVK